ncbi:MAG: hypothetical protein CM15mP107_0280 [Bacteroidota bacterium]|nr:MAG: hypothetical protein CM15mP107_0280 [Bacteroidota bacterium]
MIKTTDDNPAFWQDVSQSYLNKLQNILVYSTPDNLDRTTTIITIISQEPSSTFASDCIVVPSYICESLI